MARVIGWTDEVTTCDCCGKQDLKRVCAVASAEGEVKYYGSVCVAKSFGKKTGKEMVARADVVALIVRAKDRAEFALRRFGWSTSNGWIVDGFGQPVIEAR